ncbi:START-like domain-containing protein [Niabella sp. W65]|nr:START-like domain-containing protein [Niabella sp. W65]MCH7368211.1 START-like domain-containing protein [Niabella sp. W65]ULT43820.1 START-like domain-containing protein [Niabella sp. I65]
MSKQKFTLEYPVRCSPTILYEFLATSNGLGEWFAEHVDERDGKFFLAGTEPTRKLWFWSRKRRALSVLSGPAHRKTNILNLRSTNPK